MKIELTIDEAIYIYNRLRGREIDNIAEFVFRADKLKNLIRKLKRQIDKEIIAEGWNG